MSNIKGKSYWYLSILAEKERIDKGLRFVLVTDNPDKIKREFELITGHRLLLDLREGSSDSYDLTID